MKLETRFKALERTAFGPWLAAFKNFFTKKDLEQDALKIEKENLPIYDLAILSNTIIETGDKISVIAIKKIILDYKNNISDTMLKIEHFSLEEFRKFITNLPKDFRNFNDYFSAEEKKDGYSKIESYVNIPNKNLLIEKCDQFDDYKEIQVNVLALKEFLDSEDPDYSMLQTELLANYDYNYGCSGV